jgi:hypothetical protein
MKAIEAKKEAYRICTIVINELLGSDCTDNPHVKKELEKISLDFSRSADRLQKTILKMKKQ